ncbi:MAG: protein phosphatase CheZ [Alphaproteobacteria bacterium]|jgi:chemotaxis protein CheZ|nr:protein phosphatase CheZ [Alphaproteobacteria bacterium]MDP6515740.1 protein phosphatase CheZ [Alphaproteobacteria bacterium]|tara:strand:+ start:455 stop:1108 length:654 start_codon:yes stop_codon:yes gene_type:complete
MGETELTKELDARFAAPRERLGDTVEIADIEAVMTAIFGSSPSELTALAERERHVQSELGQSMAFMRTAREELAGLEVSEIRRTRIPDANDELEEIVSATETATNDIMDAAERIEALVAEGDDDLPDRVTVQITRIFESCGFQDITGQRIGKVVETLRHIEAKIAGLSGAGDGAASADREPPAEKAAPSDADLLNGPQASGEAQSQADIDKLFSSLD